MAIGESYEKFVDKFVPKKTTDDCYTPPNVMRVVEDFVCREYGVNRADFVRPFFPGGDYERFNYPAGCVVVDNPPFSILSEILRFYAERGVRFFLFAPSLTVIGTIKASGASVIFADADITYENGATVRTAFVTNMDGCLARSAPELCRELKAANAENLRALHRELPKYSYPDEVITATSFQKMAKYGVAFSVLKSDCVIVRTLDAQRGTGKSIYGSGLLLSERVAAQRAAAERVAAQRAAAERVAAQRAAAERENRLQFPLSEREREIVASLGE